MVCRRNFKNASKMETTLLGLAMPSVLPPLKEMLNRKGFLVQTMPTHNPVLVAYRKGNWLRSARQLIIEISSIEKNLTRIDVTAIITGEKVNKHTEEVIEETFATVIYNYFKKVIQ
jgi:hypothetical protein